VNQVLDFATFQKKTPGSNMFNRYSAPEYLANHIMILIMKTRSGYLMQTKGTYYFFMPEQGIMTSFAQAWKKQRGKIS
jgi:hypothetical protein